MRKNFNRWLALCLICSMLILLAACTKEITSTSKDSAANITKDTDTESISDKSKSEGASPSEEPVTLRMIQRLNAQYVVEDNPIIDELEKRLNIILEIEAPPINNYGDRLNIVMASGDLPDIIYLNNTGAQYQLWAENGLLLKLDDYFENSMPNARKVLTDEELALVRVQSLDNGLYSLPRATTKSWDCIIYRKDWLDKLGLKVPTTPSEFAEVMLAFAKQDPDGDGKDNTYGWAYNRALGQFSRNLINGFGIRPSSVPDENGNYELIQAQEGYMEFVDWLRSMYLNGAMDPEWYLIKAYEDDDKWNAGQIGAIYANKAIEHMVTSTNNEIKNVDPNAELVAGPPLRQEGKTISDVYYPPLIWGNYAISADSEHIEKAIEFLDYGYTDECNMLLLIGIEGLTYTSYDPVARVVTRTKEQKELADKYCSTYATINCQAEDKGLLLVNGDTEEEVAIFRKAYDEIGAQTNRISYLPESILAGINEATLKITDSGVNDSYKEYETKYICGQISREEFVNFIKNVYVPAYEEYMEVIRKSGINKK